MDQVQVTRMVSKVASLIDIDVLKRRLRLLHRGFDSRVKLKVLSPAIFGDSYVHGSSQDVALRAALARMSRQGTPIGSKGGVNGGYWWLGNEHERQQAVDHLTRIEAALARRKSRLLRATL